MRPRRSGDRARIILGLIVLLMMRLRPALSILLIGALIASQTGCASRGGRAATAAMTIVDRPQQPSPGLSAIVALGPTGVVGVWGASEAHVDAPPSGWRSGAWRGAAAGAVVSVAGGVAIGSMAVGGRGCIGNCRFEGAWLLAWTALGLALTPVSAAVGTVVGVVKAAPPARIERARGALIDAVAAADLPQAIRDETIRLGSERTWHTLVPLTGQAPETADHDVGTVLEIVVRHVGLERLPGTSGATLTPAWFEMDPDLCLRLEVDARLLRVSDGAVLYADSFQEIGVRRKFSQWTADDGRDFREGLAAIAGIVADRITRAVFPEPDLGTGPDAVEPKVTPSPEPTPAAPPAPGSRPAWMDWD